MAYKPAEVWVNEANTMVAIKAKSGGWVYFTNTGSLAINSQYLEDNPTVARAISELNLEMMEAMK